MKSQLIYTFALALLLGATVAFGAGVYAHDYADSSDHDGNPDEPDAVPYSVPAPGTGYYEWSYSIVSAASVAIYGTGTGNALASATAEVSGLAGDNVASSASRSTPGTKTDPDSASSSGGPVWMVENVDSLDFLFDAYAKAIWEDGSTYTVDATAAATGDGSIW